MIKNIKKKNTLKKNIFWICGKHSVIECLKNSQRKIFELVVFNNNVDSLQQLAIKKNIKITIKGIEFFNSVFKDNVAHQGYAALIENKEQNKIKDLKDFSNFKTIVAIDRISDPRNVGSIIRSGVAFGYTTYLFDKGGFNEKSYLLYKAASGAMEHVTLYQSSNIYNDIKFLKSKNFLIVSMDSENSESLYNYYPEHKKDIIVFGSESAGVRKQIQNISDFNFSIPTSKPIQSLNVSNSAAVVFSILDYKKKARHL